MTSTKKYLRLFECAEKYYLSHTFIQREIEREAETGESIIEREKSTCERESMIEREREKARVRERESIIERERERERKHV